MLFSTTHITTKFQFYKVRLKQLVATLEDVECLDFNSTKFD